MLSSRKRNSDLYRNFYWNTKVGINIDSSSRMSSESYQAPSVGFENDCITRGLSCWSDRQRRLLQIFTFYTFVSDGGWRLLKIFSKVFKNLPDFENLSNMNEGTDGKCYADKKTLQISENYSMCRNF